MSQQTLIPVFSAVLKSGQTTLCSGRSLHAFLGVGREFSAWITQRISDYAFLVGEDFAVVDSPKPENQVTTHGGDRKRRDYHLSLDMAKELAMIERTPRGRQVRRYFIACEQRQAQPAGDLARLAAERDALRAALLAENPQFRKIVKYHQIAGLTNLEKACLMGWTSAEAWRLALKKLAALKLVDYTPDPLAGARNLAAGRVANATAQSQLDLGAHHG